MQILYRTQNICQLPLNLDISQLPSSKILSENYPQKNINYLPDYPTEKKNLSENYPKNVNYLPTTPAGVVGE